MQGFPFLSSTTTLHSFSRNLENFRSRSEESRTFAGPDPSRQNVRIGSFCPHKTTHDSHRYLNHRPRHFKDFAYCWLSSIYKALPFLLLVSFIVHSFVKNTIYANGTIVALFVENNVMSYLQTKEPRFDDIISLLKENRQIMPFWIIWS